MTVIGKILTFLVFFLSLIFLGFAITINRLNKDPQTKLSWYDAAKRYQEDRDNAIQEFRARGAQLVQKDTDIARLSQELATEKNAHAREVETEKQRGDRAEAQVRKIETDFQNAQNAAMQATQQLQTRTDEVTRLAQELKNRDLQIADMYTRETRANNARIQAETAMRSYKDRLESLESQHQELVRTVEAARERPAPGARAGAEQERLALKPPRADVQGIVLAVSQEGLVEVSIGSDDELSRGDTLEVYRLQPRPQYLGVIKLVDVRADRSVGKVMSPQYKNKIQPNDTVSSTILQKR